MRTGARDPVDLVAELAERGDDDAERRALAGRAVDVDAAVVGTDELAHDREADAGAAGRPRARAVAAPETGEDVAQVVGGDAEPGVG